MSYKYTNMVNAPGHMMVKKWPGGEEKKSKDILA